MEEVGCKLLDTDKIDCKLHGLEVVVVDCKLLELEMHEVVCRPDRLVGMKFEFPSV